LIKHTYFSAVFDAGSKYTIHFALILEYDDKTATTLNLRYSIKDQFPELELVHPYYEVQIKIDTEN